MKRWARFKHVGRLTFPTCILLLGIMQTASSQDLEDVKIETKPLRGGVHVLFGRGGNVGVVADAEGFVLVDDQYAPLAPRILAALAKLGDGKVAYVVNTHWHFDHTGGNAALAETGAVVIAHDEVRRRMSTDQYMEAFAREVPASPPEALPRLTFDRSFTLHRGGMEIHVVHVGPAHTDGDAIVRFVGPNVLHLGDTFVNGMYPFIDRSSGGRFTGAIAAVDRALALSDAETIIIPGHGPIADREDLVAYREMLVDVRDRIRFLIRVGKSREQVVAEKPTAHLDDRWGRGFMTPEVFTGIVYDSLSDRAQ